MNSKAFFASAVAAVALATGASAGTTVFNFGSPTGNLGTSHTYTVGGLSIVATGYDSKNKKTDLFGKNDGGDEIGLGLTNDPSGAHEIAYDEGFVQLNVNGLGADKAVTFSTNSTTDGEDWAVYGSNKAGKYSGTALLTGMTESKHTLPDFGTFKYYDFVELSPPSGADGGDFLIHQITVSNAVPEPSAWAMMLTGLFGMGAAFRRQRRATVTA